MKTNFYLTLLSASLASMHTLTNEKKPLQAHWEYRIENNRKENTAEKFTLIIKPFMLLSFQKSSSIHQNLYQQFSFFQWQMKYQQESQSVAFFHFAKTKPDSLLCIAIINYLNKKFPLHATEIQRPYFFHSNFLHYFARPVPAKIKPRYSKPPLVLTDNWRCTRNYSRPR